MYSQNTCALYYKKIISLLATMVKIDLHISLGFSDLYKICFVVSRLLGVNTALNSI